MKKRIFTRKRLIIVALCILLLLAIYLVCNQFVIIINNYSITSNKVEKPVKIALITDLHNANFGNDKIISEKVAETNPDIIAVVGDIIDERNADIQHTINALKPLPDIAPTYFVLGNHDTYCPSYNEFITAITENGIVFLDDQITDITVKGSKISLYGMTAYSNGEFETPAYTKLMDDFCTRDSYKILLCHYPEYTYYFFERDKYYVYDFDLMLSGHTHGGAVQIPFLGGFYAPEQGFFPRYSKGLYYIEESNKNPFYMLISAGLGGDDRFIRFNNFPEVTTITISKKS